ncbi:hypothetical protein DLAC_01757 [Tieghemostelium lacteum]|uniref:B box-type domain-containing protein n=1 Tax=Tieghemostelium lacteum TaxID=361077 RepID=A0A152A699_TIELA|nr:hypothetical protein DLAC_01757 [Tieghemostelium lacteum]|eukprot:KYR01748.1 hypothetical protein DLAC_01757 [Tieghemostelium lacteum]
MEHSHHEESIDHICENCSILLCKECLKSHQENGHVVVDYVQSVKDGYNRAIENNVILENSINEKVKRKFLVEDSFKKVTSENNTNTSTIDRYFRELHDLLHVKEVELKRELKSYQDENYETYCTLLSKLDYEIKQSQIIQNHLKSSLDPLSQSKVTNMEFLNNVKEVLTPLQSTQGEVESQSFTQSTFTNEPIGDIIKATENLSLKNSSIYLNTDDLIIRITPKSIETFDIVNQYIEKNQYVKTPHQSEGYFFYQNAFIKNDIYIFYQSKYFHFNTKDPNSFQEFPFALNNTYNSRALSTIYDGKDSIYILGGYSNQIGIVDTIYRFNIYTKLFQLLDSTLLCKGYWLSLSLNGRYIYIIGGWGRKPNDVIIGFLNRIDQLDTDTGEIKNLKTEFQGIPTDSVMCGCYQPSTNKFYFYTKHIHEFYEYDLQLNESTKLAKPPTASTFCCKLAISKNTIYLISGGPIHMYNTQKNVWAQCKNSFNFNEHKFEEEFISLQYN